MKKRSCIVALILSILVPGLGQIYNGQFRKGILIISVLFLSVYLFFVPFTANIFSFLLSFFAILFVLLYAIIESVVFSCKVKEISINSFNRIYVYTIIIVIYWLFSVLVLSSPKELKFHLYTIETWSMEPTILEGERLYCDMRYFKDHTIVQGDLVVFSFGSSQNDTYLQRCVATEGQTVEVIDGNPFVDKKPIWNYGASLRYVPIIPRTEVDPNIFPEGAGNVDNYGPVIVPKDKYFMLGDNVPNSRDSRLLGFIDKRLIKGKPIFVYWSSDISRIGKTLK